jgi:glucose-1-phosphate thymidylyltransferase
LKGIVLAGGTGSRLWPITSSINKHLLPIYDKPMIFYPVSVLMMAGIRDILLITTKSDLCLFKSLLGDGSDWGIQISYEIQEKPAGIAQAFLIGESFIGSSNVALILGDNIFYGDGLIKKLNEAKAKLDSNISSIFAYRVDNPSRFGVVDFDKNGFAKNIEEKPEKPKSNYAVTGLYFYTNKVIEIAKSLNPSKRGELEITDVNKAYLEGNELNCVILGRGFAWLDTGTYDSLLDAASFIATLKKRQGYRISVPEEISYRLGYINREKLNEVAKKYGQSPYGLYLSKLSEENSYE